MSKTKKPEEVSLGQILTETQEISKRIGDIDTDLEEDRHNLQNLTVEIATIQEQNRQIMRAISLTPRRIKDKVADAVEPVTESTDRLTAQIQKNKMVRVSEPKTWFKKIVDRIKGVK